MNQRSPSASTAEFFNTISQKRSFHNRSFREQAVALRPAPIIEFTRSAFVPKAQVDRDRRHFRKYQKADYKVLNEFLLTEPMRLVEECFHRSTHFESGREAVVDHTFPPARHRQHLRRRWARYGRAAAGGLINTGPSSAPSFSRPCTSAIPPESKSSISGRKPAFRARDFGPRRLDLICKA